MREVGERKKGKNIKAVTQRYIDREGERESEKEKRAKERQIHRHREAVLKRQRYD